MKSNKIVKNITTIDEGARRYLDITRDEYALCQYIQFRAADPRQRVPGRCCDAKESIADFIGITRAGLYKMLDKLSKLNLLYIEPLCGAIAVSPVWMDTMSVNKVDTLSLKSVNLVDSQSNGECKQSLHQSVNKVTHNIEVKEDISMNITVGSNNPTAFDQLWNQYNFKRGSKRKALEKFNKLSEAERQNLATALPAYLSDTCIHDRKPGEPFKPLRKHLEFFISGRVWEAYMDKIQESRGDDQQTPYDEQYGLYLEYCQKNYPAILESIRHLSKKQFVEYKEANYLPALHRIGTKMQRNEFLNSHLLMHQLHPDSTKHPNVWEYHKWRMSNTIKAATTI